MRSALRDNRRSRAIALMDLPPACSRRIRTTVSTTNIPISPPGKPCRCLNHRNGGSLLDADHPANRVPFAPRSTILADAKHAARGTALFGYSMSANLIDLQRDAMIADQSTQVTIPMDSSACFRGPFTSDEIQITFLALTSCTKWRRRCFHVVSRWQWLLRQPC